MMGGATYARERAELESSLACHRVELERALVRLPETTLRALSPRRQVARRPYVWLAVGLGVGVALGLRSIDDD